MNGQTITAVLEENTPVSLAVTAEFALPKVGARLF